MEVETTAADRDVRDLRDRLHGHLESTGLLPPGAGLTVALSGGLDSVVLFDVLLDLRARWGWRVSAAHFDHRMRPGSGADAEWVAELCRRSGVECRIRRAAVPASSEAEARRLRYAALLAATRAFGADRLVTAHHADDQAETVLFRWLRGSGLSGLAGMPARREPGIARPLLPFWRWELELYAREWDLGYRVDPTNADLSIARNRLRHRVIPAIEERDAPDLRVQLVRLGDLARRGSTSLYERLDRALDTLVLEEEEGQIVVARSGLLAYDEPTRAHLIRQLIARIGSRPGRAGTWTALNFISTGSSGRRLSLRGGITLGREFDRLVIERAGAIAGAGPRDDSLGIPAPDDGAGELEIGAQRWRVRWGADAMAEAGERIARFAPSDVRFPLTIRTWRPGDRIELRIGRRKLKKLFVERRVGLSERSRYPVVADRSQVLWIVGLACGERGRVPRGGRAFTICIRPEERR